jgi:cobalt-zinc-cadmium efflux system membrane fusion protein
MKKQYVCGSLVLLAASIGCGHAEQPAAAEAPAAAPPGELRFPPNSPRLAFIKVEEVREADSAGPLSLTGRVGFDEDHTQRVASPIDGRVTALLVEPGARVKAGQRLFELTSPEVGRIQADAQKALQDLSVAQKALDRVQKMRVDGAASEKDLVQAQADFKKERSDVERSETQLKALGIGMSDPTVNAAVRAQIAGTVVARNVLVGQEVRADAAEPLIAISNLDTVWVSADVYEQDLGLVEIGDPVHLHAPAYPEATFDGVVGYVGDVVDAQSRTVKIRCVFENKNHQLKPEMFVKVDVESRSGKKVLAIPAKAVLSEGETTKVIVALEGNVFRERKIEVGPEHDGQVRVLGGLLPREKIVTDGALFIADDLKD